MGTKICPLKPLDETFIRKSEPKNIGTTTRNREIFV